MLYSVNEAKIISETLGNETILIDLENGNYYSMNDAGSMVWELLKAKQSSETIKSYFVRAYGISEDESAKSVDSFLAALKSDGLVVETEAGEDVPSEMAVGPAGRPFVAPVFQRYDDMQQMLQADPIHDVDEKGWPLLKVE